MSTCLRQTVKVVVEVGDEKEIREYDVKQLKFKPRRRKEKRRGRETGRKRTEETRSNGEKGRKIKTKMTIKLYPDEETG